MKNIEDIIQDIMGDIITQNMIADAIDAYVKDIDLEDIIYSAIRDNDTISRLINDAVYNIVDCYI